MNQKQTERTAAKMISYEPLWITLVKKGMKKKELYSVASSATIARMGKGEYIALEVLDKICAYLDCQISDVIEYRPEKKNPED